MYLVADKEKRLVYGLFDTEERAVKYIGNSDTVEIIYLNKFVVGVINNSLIADIRNKMSPIKNLLALLEKADNPFYNNDKVNKLIKSEIQKSKKAIKLICKQ
jgi:hypothetical protein